MATATKTRITKKVISNVSETAAQDAAASYTKTMNRLQAVEADMNERINTIKQNYQKEITDLKAELKEPGEVLETYAKEQQGSWGKKKSKDLLHATIGFRTGNPEVVKSKNFTWDGIVELMKKNKILSRFLRVKEEVNKEAVLAEKSEALINQLKEEAFLSVEQKETFFITPKVEEV